MKFRFVAIAGLLALSANIIAAETYNDKLVATDRTILIHSTNWWCGANKTTIAAVRRNTFAKF